MLRTPSAIEGEGGAISEDDARAKGRMVQVRDQMAQLAAENGLKVAPGVANSLLPTPTVVDMGARKTPDEWDDWTVAMKEKTGNGNGHGASLNIEMVRLLPTPNTMDHLPARTPEQKAANKGKGGYANVRETVVNDLLPTPVTTDHKQNDSPAAWDRHSPQMGTIVHSTDWGKFQPAIERWEQVLGRPAPAPTKPDGKDGAHRLSSAFTEWMMGLPDGWITGVGLTRNEELKACGNGVVPQQAELALRILLDGVSLEREREREREL
jgi:DNA (cytosine-5)-methyltransferase 1